MQCAAQVLNLAHKALQTTHSFPYRHQVDRALAMGFSLKEFIFGGTTFCCCFPVRFGVIAMALMSMFIAGALAIVSWFEVASKSRMSYRDSNEITLC